MQKIIRTYPNGYTNALVGLEQLLEDGWEVVICTPITNKDGTVCNDYIVEKKEPVTKS
jgi:hypothetical protein